MWWGDKNMEHTINEAKKALRMVFKPGKIQPSTPFLWGPPGIGKSELVAQMAKEFTKIYKKPFQLIDYRLAQIESSDLKGIPVIDPKNGVLHWAVPEDLPTEDNPIYKDTQGFLFLDELNRARAEVQQATFQLVLDRRIGGHKLLDSWFIIAAGNYGYEDDTDVGEMDSAFKNRFSHYEIKCEVGEWLEWARNTGVHEDVVGFIQTHPDKLYYKLDGKKESPISLVTPRSWVKFSNILQQNQDEFTPKEINQALGPTILSGCSAYFGSYLDDKNIVSAEDIVLHYKKVATKLKTFQRDQIQAINQEVTSFVSKHSNEWDEATKKIAIENFNRYMEDCLEVDLAVAFCKYTWKSCKAVKSTFMKDFMLTYPDKTNMTVSVLDNPSGGRR